LIDDRFQYLETDFSGKEGCSQHRTTYGKVESGILGFLQQEDWIAIAGQSESDEVLPPGERLQKG
jgi:hypothetical protein